MRGEGAGRRGSRDHARQIEHAHAGKRSIAGGKVARVARRQVEGRDVEQRLGAHRGSLVVREPFFPGARNGRARADCRERILELERAPGTDRTLHFVAYSDSAEHAECSFEMMREVRMELDEAFVAGAVETADRAPHVARRAAVDPEQQVGAERVDRALYREPDPLGSTAAPFVDERGRPGRGAGGCSRGRADREARRQDRIVRGLVDVDVGERSHRPAERRPRLFERDPRLHCRVHAVTIERAHT